MPIPVPRGIWDRSQVGSDERSFGMKRSLWNSSGAGSRFLSPRSRDSHPKIPRILRRTPNLGPFPARFSLGDAPGSGDGSQVSPCLPPAPSAPREMWGKKGNSVRSERIEAGFQDLEVPGKSRWLHPSSRSSGIRKFGIFLPENLPGFGVLEEAPMQHRFLG